MKRTADEIEHIAENGLEVSIANSGFSVSTDNSDIVERLEEIGNAINKQRRFNHPFIESQLQRVGVAMAKRCKLKEVIDTVVAELLSSDDGGASLSDLPRDFFAYFDDYPVCHQYHRDSASKCNRLFCSEAMLSEHRMKAMLYEH